MRRFSDSADFACSDEGSWPNLSTKAAVPPVFTPLPDRRDRPLKEAQSNSNQGGSHGYRHSRQAIEPASQGFSAPAQPSTNRRQAGRSGLRQNLSRL